MNILSNILLKAGLIVEGTTNLQGTATAVTPAAGDNSTKIATTAWVTGAGYLTNNLYTADGTLTGNRAVTLGANSLTFSASRTVGSAMVLNHTQTAANSSDNVDSAFTLNSTLTGSGGGTQLVTRTFYLVNSHQRTGTTVTYQRIFNLVANTAASTTTQYLDYLWLERGTASGSVSYNRAIVINNLQGTNQAGLVVGALDGTNNTHALLGQGAIPTGNWSVYAPTSTYNNYFGGKVLIGTSTVGTFNLDVNGTARISSNLTANSFIKSGGTAAQFLKADGSVDSTVYATDSAVVHIAGTETVTGTKTFEQMLTVGTTSVTGVLKLQAIGGESASITKATAGGLNFTIVAGANRLITFGTGTDGLFVDNGVGNITLNYSANGGRAFIARINNSATSNGPQIEMFQTNAYATINAGKYGGTGAAVPLALAVDGTQRVIVFTDGNVSIGSATNTALAKLQVTGAIQQSSVLSSMLKVDSSGVLVAAVAGTDYQAAGSYVLTSRTLTINGTAYDLSADRSWTIDAGGATASTRTIQKFTTTAGQTTFTITGGYTVGMVDVFVNGVKIDNATDFTATNGTTVVLTDAIASGQTVEVYKYGSQFIVNNGLRQKTLFSATAGQTTFTVNYSVNMVDVFYNGSKLDDTEYTATNGTTIVFNTACAVNDKVEVIAYTYTVGAFTGVGGSGTTNFIPKWTASGTLGNSLIQDNGITITLGGALSGTSASFNATLKTKGLSSYDGIVEADNSTTTGGGIFRIKQNGVISGFFSVRGSVLGTSDRNMAYSAEAGLGHYFYVNDGTLALTLGSTGAATFSSSVTAAGSLIVTRPSSGATVIQMQGTSAYGDTSTLQLCDGRSYVRSTVIAGTANGDTDMTFGTQYLGAISEKIRITSLGALLINTTSDAGTGRLQVVNSSAGWGGHITNSNGQQVLFSHGGGYGMNVNAGSNASASTYIAAFVSNSTDRLIIQGDGKITAAAANSGWSTSFFNAWSSSVQVFLSHGGGYGIAVDSAANTSGVYLIKLSSGDGTNRGTVEQFKVRNDGALFAQGIYNFTTGSGANVVVFSDGSMQRSTSSLKYKKNVQNYTKGLAEVMQMRPVTYNSKNELETQTYAGLIAEEVHELGLSEYVQYAQDGTPDALSYGNMVSLAFKAIQDLKKERDADRLEIESLKSQLGSN